MMSIYYVFKRMYIYKRKNVRVEFNDPNAPVAEVKLQYKVNLFGMIPYWKTVYADEYSYCAASTAIEDPIRYSSRIIAKSRAHCYKRAHRRKIRQMKIKLKKQNNY